MFNVWRKAWAKDKESNLDDSPLTQHKAASEGNLDLDVPETIEDGIGAQAAPLVLDGVQNAACPESASSSISGTAVAHDVGVQHANESLHSAAIEDSAVNDESCHDRDPPPPAKRRKVAHESPDPDLHVKDEARLKFEAAIGANSAAPH